MNIYIEPLEEAAKAEENMEFFLNNLPNVDKKIQEMFKELTEQNIAWLKIANDFFIEKTKLYYQYKFRSIEDEIKSAPGIMTISKNGINLKETTPELRDKIFDLLRS